MIEGDGAVYRNGILAIETEVLGFGFFAIGKFVNLDIDTVSITYIQRQTHRIDRANHAGCGETCRLLFCLSGDIAKSGCEW